LRRNANDWIEGVARTRNRMTDHLNMTNVPEDQFGVIDELQMRLSRQVLSVFGRETSCFADAETISPVLNSAGDTGGNL
jgi:hypothetical protein